MVVTFDADIKTETMRGVIRICVERGRFFGIMGDIGMCEWIYVWGSGRLSITTSLRTRPYGSSSSQSGLP